jgi:hypothetical protein
MDPDPDPGGPKTCGSGFGSGSATLEKSLVILDNGGYGAQSKELTRGLSELVLCWNF